MNETANYLIMILSPFVFLISKLSVQYAITYDILRKRHSKTYIKKHGGNFLNRFFALNFKKEIGTFWFFINFILGVLTIVGFVLSPIYLLLWILGHKLFLTFIPNVVVALIIILMSARLIRLVYDKINK